MDTEEFEEQQDEQPPESLRKKWEMEDFKEEITGKGMRQCPACKKPVDAKSLSCLYCGEVVFHQSGLLGNLLYGSPYSKWVIGLIVGVMILGFLWGSLK